MDIHLSSHIIAATLSQYITGMLNQPNNAVDGVFSNQVHNHLFDGGRDGVGLDLFAINIQRGRGHGIPGSIYIIKHSSIILNCLFL